jgi:hypothetical protein
MHLQRRETYPGPQKLLRIPLPTSHFYVRTIQSPGLPSLPLNVWWVQNRPGPVASPRTVGAGAQEARHVLVTEHPASDSSMANWRQCTFPYANDRHDGCEILSHLVLHTRATLMPPPLSTYLPVRSTVMTRLSQYQPQQANEVG